MKKVLFVDEVHPVLAERLTALGFDCEYDYHSSKSEIEQKNREFLRAGYTQPFSFR